MGTTFRTTAFHGTRHYFEEFEPSDRGYFGAGIYLGSTLEQGLIFSGEEPDVSKVIEVEVVLDRPYHYKVKEYVDTSAWGVSLVREMFHAPRAQGLIQRAQDGDGQFGLEIAEQMIAWGHDGIVATFEDGSQEIVVYDSARISIVSRMTLDEALRTMRNGGVNSAYRPGHAG